MPATKQQIRQIIADNNLNSAADVYSLLRDSFKDILSITVGANETSKFWLGMLNDLKNRGVQDVLFFCVDGVAGFKEAVKVYLCSYLSQIRCSAPVNITLLQRNSIVSSNPHPHTLNNRVN